MPAFKPEVSEAHFDAKISEHVAHVIDTVASMNLSAIFGNTSDVSEAVVDYIVEFSRRIPVPFHLQSSEGGFQVKYFIYNYFFDSPFWFRLKRGIGLIQNHSPNQLKVKMKELETNFPHNLDAGVMFTYHLGSVKN